MDPGDPGMTRCPVCVASFSNRWTYPMWCGTGFQPVGLRQADLIAFQVAKDIRKNRRPFEGDRVGLANHAE